MRCWRVVHFALCLLPVPVQFTTIKNPVVFSGIKRHQFDITLQPSFDKNKHLQKVSQTVRRMTLEDLKNDN